MHSNIPILSQWGVNFSDRLGPYKSYKNIVFLLITPFPQPGPPETKGMEEEENYC